MNTVPELRRPGLTYAIPAAVVLVTLIALIVLPLVITNRINRLRHDIDRRAEPARSHLNEVNYQLGAQIMMLTRAVLTREQGYVEEYREARAARDRALAPVARDVSLLDEDASTQYRALSEEIGRWDRSIERYLDDGQGDLEAADALIAREVNYTGVLQKVKALDEAISRFQSQRRQQMRQLARRQVTISVILVLLALIAAISVIWLAARLRYLAEQIARESAERMTALERERDARSEAESLLKARDEILGIVSHDLRSPLTTITLSTQLLEGSSPQEHTEHVQTILSTSKRMERLIQDLLDAVKIEGSTLAIEKRRMNPAQVARVAFTSHAPLAAEKRINLKAHIEEALPDIDGDEDRLLQALGNLLGNALKFTPPGGTIDFHADVSDGMIRFQVLDSGPGIAPSDLPNLFEPFWQGKKTAHLGAGLGLKITRAIVEAHGGSIEVSNLPGGGACFTLAVPAARPASVTP